MIWCRSNIKFRRQTSFSTYNIRNFKGKKMTSNKWFGTAPTQTPLLWDSIEYCTKPLRFEERENHNYKTRSSFVSTNKPIYPLFTV